MIFWGTTLSGDRMLLGEAGELALSCDRDAPADLLRARFPTDRVWEELRELTVFQGEDCLFRGQVDEQNTELDEAGISVELVCRSREALLLDNEAPPGSMLSPSLELLEERLLLPLGLTLGEGDRSRKRGELFLEKGESCWTVLEKFCRGWLGTRPYVDTEGRVQCAGLPGKHTELNEVISARLNLLPCKRISEVWVQSFRGSYDTRIRGRGNGPMRRRYLSAQSGGSAREILERGENNSFLLTVVCPGPVWPGKNGTVSVTAPGLGRFENCPVRSVLCRQNKNGTRTRLVLERGQNREEETVCG